jgi:HEAT repeat protein
LQQIKLDPSVPFHTEIEHLGMIGPLAHDAIPVLLHILESPQIDPAEMKNRLWFNWLRLNVILALGRIGCNDTDVIATLFSLLKADSWQDRAAAAEALSSPGISTAAVLDTLVDALHDEHAYVRANAAVERPVGLRSSAV